MCPLNVSGDGVPQFTSQYGTSAGRHIPEKEHKDHWDSNRRKSGNNVFVLNSYSEEWILKERTVFKMCVFCRHQLK